MQALNEYVEQKNSWSKLLGGSLLSLNSAKDRQKIAVLIDADLSPENLTCDGELSRGQVQQKYTRLTRAAQQLQKLDATVKFYELS